MHPYQGAHNNVDEEAKELLPDHEDETQSHRHHTFHRPRCHVLPWVLTVILGLALVLQTVYHRWLPADCHSALIHDTDFEPIKAAINYHKVRFTSPLWVDANGTFHRKVDTSAAPLYVGAPADVLNANWETLLQDYYVRLTPEEVDALNQDPELPLLTPVRRNGEEAYFAGIDMLHTMHCLNGLRKHLNPGFQDPTAPFSSEIGQLHIDHCIEQLRQSIMCHGDTTPVTLKPIWGDRVIQSTIGETERLHTCRNSLDLREWTTKRGRLTGTSDEFRR